MPEPTDKIRATIAERLIAIGATDDDGPGLFEWHPCTDREACTTVMDPPSPCPCAGRPYLNDDVWVVIVDAFQSAGRLLPEGGQTRTEWAVDGVAGYDVRGNPAPYDSEQGARAGVGYWRRHGVETRVVSREVREFDDGSSYSGPWVAVDRCASSYCSVSPEPQALVQGAIKALGAA